MYNLFIVDDDYWMRNYLKESLKWETFGVRFAGDAGGSAEACEKLELIHVDILITDIKMPGMDGIQLSELVIKKNPDVRIILISSYKEFEYARRAIGLGIMDYIMKPVEEEILADIIKKAVDSLNKKRQAVDICLPTSGVAGEQLNGTSNKLLQDVFILINEHYHEEQSLEKIAAKINVHPVYLCRLFKKETGENLIQYIMRYRIEKAMKILCHQDKNISKVASMVGYESLRTFTRVFKKITQMTPGEYRRKIVDNQVNK